MEGGYTTAHFELDWEHEQVHCPEGKRSTSWSTYHDAKRGAYVKVRFRAADCTNCAARHLCTRSASQGRSLILHPQLQHETLEAMREGVSTAAGRRRYAKRAGIEGTLPQGVRAFGLRRSRCRGQAKTHLGHVAIAAAINLKRALAWLSGEPKAGTYRSYFARLALAA